MCFKHLKLMLTDRRTDICTSRAAFAAENYKCPEYKIVQLIQISDDFFPIRIDPSVIINEQIPGVSSHSEKIYI